MNDSKSISLIQENRVANLFNGKRTPQSGAGKWRHGDVLSDNFLVECKTSLTPKPSYSIKKDILDKADRQRREMMKPFYAQAFTFGDDEDFFILPTKSMLYLIGMQPQLQELITKTELKAKELHTANQGVNTQEWDALYIKCQKMERLLEDLLTNLHQLLE